MMLAERAPLILSHHDFTAMPDETTLADTTNSMLEQRPMAIKLVPTAAGYREALSQAQTNLRILVGSGVPVAFGTDSGPPGRFPGYFEQLEFGLRADAGLTASEIMLSATSVGASCLALDDVGTLEPGTEADIVVLDARATPAMALRMERAQTLSEELFILQILGDDRAVAQTYVAGAPQKR